jgi:hypothetical protein
MYKLTIYTNIYDRNLISIIHVINYTCTYYTLLYFAYQMSFQNRRNIGEKIVPRKQKAQNVVCNLKGRIPLFYCAKHNHGQFKTYLKLRNIRFKQILK